MSERGEGRYRAIVMGVSTGGVGVLRPLLGALPAGFPLPVIVVQHLNPQAGGDLARFLDETCAIRVKEADDREAPAAGTVYLAPANYHLLVDLDRRFALSLDPPVNCARPSVDLLFESAAEAYGAALVGVVLTGAGQDGSRGLARIKECGGLTVVQDPADATAASMPRHALEAVAPDHLVALATMPQLFINLSEK